MPNPHIIRYKWRREFVGSMDEAFATARWLDDIAAQQRLSGRVVFAAQLCLEEILTNIVRHSGKTEPHVAVEVDHTGDRLQLTIEDDGKPFDVTSYPRRPVERDLETVEPGGLGLHLLQHFASQLEYSRSKDHNRVTAVFCTVAERTSQHLPS